MPPRMKRSTGTPAELTRIFRPESWAAPLALAALFPRSQPAVVDVGCGKGRFLAGRARRFPEFNYLGIDRMADRLRRLDRRVSRTALPNVRLLRAEAWYAVRYLLPAASIRTVFLLFPDPWPKRRHHKHRLFGPEFMDALHRCLEPNGEFHVATDHLDYFETIRKLMADDRRFDPAAFADLTDEERTDFELIFLSQGKPIGRCAFRKRDG